MKKLSAVFYVPKTKIKNANIPLNHIVASQKSLWIRNNSEEIWAKAVKDQFGITAIEPDEIIIGEVSEEVKEKMNELDSLQKNIDTLSKEKKEMENNKSIYSGWKKQFKKTNDEKEKAELEEKIFNYERRETEIKAALKRIRATKSSFKKRYDSDISKEIRSLERKKRNEYIKQKLELNSHQTLFNKCAVIVRVSNISAHDFDSPNFYPTLKPILDAATDCGVIWGDDNNNVISGGVLFLPGGKSPKSEYQFEVEIVDEWPWVN